MRNKVLLSFILSVFCIMYSYAEKVDIEKAEKVARSYVNSVPRLSTKKDVQFSRTVFKELKPDNPLRASQEEAMYYVFSMNNDEGFVIVSADDVAVPVLGYSEEGSYDDSNPNFSYWMDCLAQEIASAIENNISQSAEIKAKWDARLSENTSALRASSYMVVAPMVKTKWNQGDPYNKLCPSGTVTGCVATAMAQIMKYWDHPETGSGSHSYLPLKYPSQSADFTDDYDWENMTNVISSYFSNPDEIDAVATLMYHCGVSVEMEYDTPANGGSGASSADVAPALVTYFKYDAGINYLRRNYYSYTEWLNFIKTELEAERPVYYSGQGSGGGHAFVCDGYDSDNLFHFNWGWGGSSDGYFGLSALNPPSLGIGGGAGGFNTSQAIIVGIRPEAGGSSPSSDFRLGLLDIYSATSTPLHYDVSNSLNSDPFEVTLVRINNIGLSFIPNPVRLGIHLCKDDGAYIVNTYSYNLYNIGGGGLNPGSYLPGNIILSDYTLPPGLTPGTYKLYGAFSTATAPNTPIKIEGMNGDQYIRIVIESDGETVHLEHIAPDLSLLEPITVGDLYQNRIGKFTAKIANSGEVDYNSQLTIALSGTGIATDPVVIPAGTTKEVEFSATISLIPGSYNLTLLYDPNNIQSNPSAQLGSPQPVTVVATPAAPVLSATLSFDNPSAVSANKPNLEATITNTGGVFVGVLTANIYPSGGVTSLGSFGSKAISLEPGQITLYYNEPVALPPGAYFTIIWADDTQISAYYYFSLIAPDYSPDATLSNLTVDQGTLSPAFDANTLYYTVHVANNISSISLTGMPNDEYAAVVGNGIKSLSVGENTFTIKVTAEDGTVNLYQVTVNRAYEIVTWTPQSSSTNWDDLNNWVPQVVPSSSHRAVIPKSSSYPILALGDNATAGEILFEPGAELGNQHLLDYQKAYVQLDFSPTPNPTTLSRNRWWMLTNPLQELYAGDFSFGGLPGMAIQKYGLASGEQGEWISLDYDDKLEAGDSFILWLRDDPSSSEVKGLKYSQGIITLPYFEDPNENDVHWTHVYNSGTKKSTFYGWDEITPGEFEATAPEAEVDRTAAAYQLVNGSSLQKTLDFGLGEQERYYYAATGNPFMSSISFDALQKDEDNEDLIVESYWVWVGAGAKEIVNPGSYAIYNITAGQVGYTASKDDVFPEDYLSDIIPPMQSFIVQSYDGDNDSNVAPGKTTITFDIETISATGQNTTGLRASTLSNDLLEIIASTPQSAVRAVVASREQGSQVFNRKDASKLFAGINSLPDIYMLKPAADNRIVRLGANIVNAIEEDLVIPLGIATTYEGPIALSFAGMNTYNARIFLIDAASPDKKEIELTGQANYKYTFDYQPEKVNGTPVSNENRFFIRLSATNPTGPEYPTSDRILVYSPKANTLQAVSGELIQQVSVFNIQGQKIYDKASIQAYEHTVTDLAPGVYLAKIINTNEVKTVKIVVR